MLEGTEDVVVTATDNETDSTHEGNASTSTEGSESDSITLTKAELDQRERDVRKDQDKRWKERVKGLKGDEEGDGSGKESSKEAHTPEITERLDRTDLRLEGIKDKSEQDAVMEYARFKNIDVLSALNSPAMKAELKEMRNKSATPASSVRTSTGARDEVSYWADQTEKGKMAPTAELRKKVLAYLAQNRR